VPGEEFHESVDFGSISRQISAYRSLFAAALRAASAKSGIGITIPVHRAWVAMRHRGLTGDGHKVASD
jgi:hypothetical protein